MTVTTVERVPLPQTSTVQPPAVVAPPTPVPQPDARGPEYDGMVPLWAKADALCGGTDAMQAAGPLYMKPHPREKTPDYEFRLGENWLFPGFTKALEDFVGEVFEHDVEILKASPVLKPVLDNMDLLGSNVTVFMRQLFYWALQKGKAHIQIDFPDRRAEKEEMRAQGREWSRKDDEKVRPYFIIQKAPDVIGWQYEITDGAPDLTVARIREVVPRPNSPFDDVSHVERIRVLYQDRQEIWERANNTAPAGSPPNAASAPAVADWQVVDTIFSPIQGVVPLVPAYTDLKHGLMTAVTPLQPMIDMNLAHWRSNGQQVHALRIARIPILFYRGASTEEAGKTLTITPDEILATTSDTAMLAFVGGATESIVVGADDVKGLETRMEAWSGAQMTQQPGDAKATGQAIQSASSGSVISSWAQGIEDAMNTAFDIADEAMGQKSGSTRIKLHKPASTSDLLGEGGDGKGTDTSAGSSAEGGSPPRPAGGQAGA